MPNYTYECTTCGKFDARHAPGDTLTRCPTCHAPVRKVILMPGVIYRGDGYYSKDSRES